MMETDHESTHDHLVSDGEEDNYQPMKFIQPGVENCEDLERYEPGGFHPVHLGDLYDNGRYKISRKLGYGGFATVWLARDLEDRRWIALKILAAAESADYSSYASIVLEDPVVMASELVLGIETSFWVGGVNGRHLCLVMPLVGTNTAQLSSSVLSRLTPGLAVELASQAVEGMALLHSRSICHGDFTANNLALALASDRFQAYEEADLDRLLGPPETAPIQLGIGASPEVLAHAPRYAVDTIDFSMAPAKLLTSELRIFDFDQAFRSDSPPKRSGTPAMYMAPEVICGASPSRASDVWSLGCTIYRLRSGEDLFCAFDTRDPADAMLEIQRFLGEPPKDMAQTRFNRDGRWTTDGDGEQLFFYEEDMTTLEEAISAINDPPTSLLSNGKTQVGPVVDTWKLTRQMRNPYPSVYDSMFWKPTAIIVNGKYLSDFDERVTFFQGASPRIGREEAELLQDLLSRIFVYDPASRISAAELAKHAWFKMYRGS